MEDLLKGLGLSEDMINDPEKIKKITWISGGCGYGKTALADSTIKKFKEKNKKACKLPGKDFVDILVKNLIARSPIDNIVDYFRHYDLLVLDDIDYALVGKPKTQSLIKEVAEKITQDGKTEVVLISQKRARKLSRLKFHSRYCQYVRLKAPSTDFKIKLAKEWLNKEKLAIPEEKIKEIAGKSNNLFQLRGLFNQTFFSIRK